MLIKEIIDKVYPISSSSLELITSEMKTNIIERGDTFIKKGKADTKEYFIISGVCKGYIINPNGQEVTLSFFDDNTIIPPHFTRTINAVSQLNYKALTPLELTVIDSKKFDKLRANNTEIRNFGLTVVEKELLKKAEREIGLASLSAKQRLVEFRKKYPLLENTIPHGDIASYLGITNISLSRLRKELL